MFNIFEERGDFIKSNLIDIQNVKWEYGGRGYDPSELIIQRFGLNYDFIQRHKLTWIDNLVTGRKSGVNNLADPRHRNNKLPYVQSYIKKFGARKCEANAIVPMPKEAQKLVENAIVSFVGTDAIRRFDLKKQEVKKEMDKIRIKTGLKRTIEKAIELIDNN